MNSHTPNGASYSALVYSFLAGGIAGAAVALLVAPNSGKDTRESIGRKLSDATGAAREMGSRAIRRGHDLREEASHRVEGAASALAGKSA